MNIQSVTNNTAVGAVVSRPPPVEGQPVPKESQAVKGSADRPAPSTGQDGQVSRQQLDQAVKAVNDFVNSVNDSLQFSVDDATGKTVVKVIDSSTKEVIKQFPSEEMLAIAKALDGIKGLLVHQKA